MADQVIVLTSTEKSDDILHQLCNEKNIPVYRGGLHNVLQRYIDASEQSGAKMICRVCGDSPFVDIESIDQMFNTIVNNPDIDYVTNESIYNGFKAEVFTLNALKKISKNILSPNHKEHVTSYLIENRQYYNTVTISKTGEVKNRNGVTLTVDYPDDLIIANKLASNLVGCCSTVDQIIKAVRKI